MSKKLRQIITESSWGKHVYHATYDKKFKPYPGMHVGTLHAAMTRAYDLYKYKGAKSKDLIIHAFSLNTKGKALKMKDAGENLPPTLFAGLRKKGIVKSIDVQPINRIQNKIIGKRFREKGLSHITYTNDVEGRGSKSHVVFDVRNLKRIHTFKAPKFMKHADKRKQEPYFEK